MLLLFDEEHGRSRLDDVVIVHVLDIVDELREEVEPSCDGVLGELHFGVLH